jgi:hypothetical protein
MGADRPKPVPSGERKRQGESLLVYLLLGVFLGGLFIAAEVVSWFRIQEMFRFQSFHMYGIIGSAIVVGATSLSLMKRMGVKTREGEPIPYPHPDTTRPHVQHVIGGTAFGLGWGLVGACPGPMFALIGAGFPIMLVALGAALAGAWTYGLLRPRLPHG